MKVCVKREPPDFALVEDGCPPYMRDMAIACLAHDAAARPTFSELVDRLVAATPGAAAGGPVSTRRGGGTVDERFAAVEAMNREVEEVKRKQAEAELLARCLLYTSPSPRDATLSRMPSSA